MSKRVQARKQKVTAPAPVVDGELIESMQHTIQELQLEITMLKSKIIEEKVAKRDKLLMESLREIRERKQRGFWNRVVRFTTNR